MKMGRWSAETGNLSGFEMKRRRSVRLRTPWLSTHECSGVRRPATFILAQFESDGKLSLSSNRSDLDRWNRPECRPEERARARVPYFLLDHALQRTRHSRVVTPLASHSRILFQLQHDLCDVQKLFGDAIFNTLDTVSCLAAAGGTG